jgi:hypothetical protein
LESSKKFKAKISDLEKKNGDLKIKIEKLKQKNIEIHIGDRKSNLK